MFYTLQEVHDAFFKVFQPTVVVPLGSTTLAIPVVYARTSNTTVAKKKLESYPRIVLLDQTIGFSKDWRPNEEKYVLGYELNEAGTANEKAWLGKDPVELIFNYQVSGYFNNLLHKIAFMQWVFENFRAFGGILLNPVTQENGEITEDSVTYSLRTDEFDRTDGIFEYNLTFTLKPLVHLEKTELLDLVEQLNITATTN